MNGIPLRGAGIALLCVLALAGAMSLHAMLTDPIRLARVSLEDGSAARMGICGTD